MYQQSLRSPTKQRIVHLALLLALLTAGAATLLSAPGIALAGPGAGWVKADVVGGGCDANGNCSSEVTPGSPTLYEYVPARESVDRNYNVNDMSPAIHGGYTTYERRDRCNIGGVYYYWSAGTWHQGARWTLQYTASGGERWIGPSNRHWAFEHTDRCEATGPNARTATPLPAQPTATLRPGETPQSLPPALTPTDAPWTPTPVPTAFIPTPVPVCVGTHALPGGMALDATQGGAFYNQSSPVGYYIPPSAPTDPPGLYDDGVSGAKIDPTWPEGRLAAPISAGEPIIVQFHPSSVRMNYPPENPLEPFTQWGKAKMFLYLIDRGTDLASSTDDRTLFRLGSDGVNKVDDGSFENGNPVVEVQDWQLAPDVAVLGPQQWEVMEWGYHKWWTQRHQSSDDSRGDYVAPDDPHWPNILPDFQWGRTLMRSPSTLGLRFTPQPNHTYDVVSDVEKLSCSVSYNNYRLMRLTTVQPIDIGISMEYPRITTPGAEITYRLIYRNTMADTSKPFRVTNTLPDGVMLVGSSRSATASNGRTLYWDLPELPGTADPAGRDPYGEIALTVRVSDTPPETLINTAMIEMESDSNPTNNRADGYTRVVSLPAPQATFRLRIHSDLDPQHGVYVSTGTAVRWPAGEVMDFAPMVTLQPAQQPSDSAYQVTHRIVGWSFEQAGNIPIDPIQCKPRTEPDADDTDGADIGNMPGCHYKYMSNPTASDMRDMAHAYWSQTLPAAMRNDVYVYSPLPSKPTQLVLDYAVLTEARENGVDLDGDGSTSSLIVRRTAITRGAFQVTLLAPRSGR